MTLTNGNGNSTEGINSTSFGESRTIFRNKYANRLIIAGLFFFGTSIILLFSIAYWMFFRVSSTEQIWRLIEEMSQEGGTNLFFLYIGVFSHPFILLIAALICILIGVRLVDQAGGIGRETIPEGDIELIGKLEGLPKSKQGGVDLYVTLTSLAGLTGFFTKIGITGLPLATIGLTLFFSIFGLLNIGDDKAASDKFFDFANLALGAFLGSYVQKKEKEIEQLKPTPTTDVASTATPTTDVASTATPTTDVASTATPTTDDESIT